jgi:hypothetical protein
MKVLGLNTGLTNAEMSDVITYLKVVCVSSEPHLVPGW